MNKVTYAAVSAAFVDVRTLDLTPPTITISGLTTTETAMTVTLQLDEVGTAWCRAVPERSPESVGLYGRARALGTLSADSHRTPSMLSAWHTAERCSQTQNGGTDISHPICFPFVGLISSA